MITNYKLNIGDVVASSAKVNYTCLGLGSCIGVFIQDRLNNLSAGAHIFLPDTEKGPENYSKFCSAFYAIDEMLRQLKFNGSDLTSLRAKITGGANVFGIKIGMGEKNVQSVIRLLTDRKIYIAAMDVGGTYCRTAKFDSTTGMLTVKTPQHNEPKTY